jgi:serine/threonine-protein kinase HipA
METFEDRRVLVVERFDRLFTEDGRLLRLPQEDMCQALGVAWTQKYENEGGPGIQAIEDLLGASDEPTRDRHNFLKANLVFWLLGATDGHAKNFSVFLSPGGGFRSTPLYDVISAQPSLDTKHVRYKDFRLAMAVGKSRHYQILGIEGRHFIESGEQAGMGDRTVSGIIAEVIETAPRAIRSVVDRLPTDFPDAVVRSVAAGIERRVAQLTKELGS